MPTSLISLGSPAINEDRLRQMADRSNQRKLFNRMNPDVRDPTPRLSAPPPPPTMTERMSQYSAKPAAPMDAITRGMSQSARPSMTPPPSAVSANAKRSLLPAMPESVSRYAGPVAAGLTVAAEGIPVAKTAFDARATKDDLEQQARSAILKSGGALAGGAIGARFGMPGSAVLGTVGYEAMDALARGMNQAERKAPMTPAEAARFVNLPQEARQRYGQGEDFNEWSQALPAPTNEVSQALPARRPAMTGDVMGPDRSAEGYNAGIRRLGNRITTPQGYVESSDQAGLARVDAGLRGTQPKDGQSYVSNNFMTMPAYKTPEWLIQAREAKAAREQATRTPSAPAAMAMPTPPAPARFDSRTMSFSDLGNMKRQNKMAQMQYAQEMAAYNNAADNAAAVQRENIQNEGALQRQQAALAVEAPYRQAMADYYRANAVESRANADWRDALAAGGLTTRDKRGGATSGKDSDNKLYSLDLGSDASGKSMRALGNPATGELFRVDPESGKLSPMPLPQPMPPMDYAEFKKSYMTKYRDTPAMLDDGLIEDAYRSLFGNAVAGMQ